jgi:hypothetical protein
MAGLTWPGDDDGRVSSASTSSIRIEVGSVDLTGGLPNASHWVHHDEAERVIQLLTDLFAPRPAERGLTKGLRRAPGARAEVVDQLGILSTTHPRSRDARPGRMSVLQEALTNSGEFDLPQLAFRAG